MNIITNTGELHVSWDEPAANENPYGVSLVLRVLTVSGGTKGPAVGSITRYVRVGTATYMAQCLLPGLEPVGFDTELEAQKFLESTVASWFNLFVRPLTTESRAFAEGRRAQSEGKERVENPYGGDPRNFDLFQQWAEGWEAGRYYGESGTASESTSSMNGENE